MGEGFCVSKAYEDSLDVEFKKTKGVYYTPKVIVEYIVNKTIKNHDVVKNPFPKILDISCGCGNFLMETYDILYDLFEENIYELKEKYDSDYWKLDNIHNHIISNCIYGADIDEEAINILKNQLINKAKDLKVDRFNLYCCDSLRQNFDTKFDYIIGNPPYVGHKKIEKEYKKFILQEYSDVYKGKADLYFCFYKKIIDSLKDDGIGSIITPRYFIESQSGRYIRKYISENVNLEEIIDFLGASIFKNIGISSCITTFKKQNQINSTKVMRIKDETINIGNIGSLEDFMEKDTFEHFTLKKDSLEEEWTILNTKDEILYNRIEAKCSYILEDICTSFQGIITGCDKAFVINKSDIRLENIEKNILKPWVKNKNIDKYIIKENDHILIYSDDITNEESQSYLIREFILKYKDKLLNRRECKKNFRKWYELQWGREKEVFERVKIMHPYKASGNKFAIDYNNSFCSADVYSFFIKDEYKEIFSYEYLVGILNSSIYNEYFKINAKKISKKIYDYYPNKVMKIKIFKDENYKIIENKSKEILACINKKEYEKINYLQKEIEILIEQSLGLI